MWKVGRFLPRDFGKQPSLGITILRNISEAKRWEHLLSFYRTRSRKTGKEAEVPGPDLGAVFAPLTGADYWERDGC